MTDEEAYQLEKTWRDGLPALSAWQWAELFQDSPATIKNGMSQQVQRDKDTLDRLVQERRHAQEQGQEWAVELIETRIEETNKHIALCIAIKQHYCYEKKNKNPQTITEADKALAKSVPIENFYSGRLRKFGGKQNGRCPFHAGGNERTPSFFVYPNNTYHCFSCQADGDVISFVQQTQNMGFLETVKYLIGK